MAVSETEFKGNPMIVLGQGDEDRYPFQFGLKKAKLVIEHIDAIKDFVEKHTPDEPQEPEEHAEPS